MNRHACWYERWRRRRVIATVLPQQYRAEHGISYQLPELSHVKRSETGDRVNGMLSHLLLTSNCKARLGLIEFKGLHMCFFVIR